MNQKFTKLQKNLEINFKNQEILELAFRHPSYLNENFSYSTNTNQRLEFLGDAILSLILADYLYFNFPDYSEGLLTDMRSELVKDQTLAKIAIKMELGSSLLLGKGEMKSGGHVKESNLADVFEALLGAIYIDQGFDIVKSVVHKIFSDRISSISIDNLKDSKSRIQEYYLNNQSVIPIYEFVKKDGTDHDPIFTMSLTINNEIICYGEGRSKKQAEQKAATIALQLIEEAQSH